MAIDNIRGARRAILRILKSTPAVNALVDAANIHPQAVAGEPSWPFIKWGSPTAIPINGTCLDGQEITVAVHSFARERSENGSVVETAEDHAARIGAAIAKALDRRKAEIPGGRLTIAYAGSRLLIDGDDASAFHAIVNLRIRCMTS